MDFQELYLNWTEIFRVLSFLLLCLLQNDFKAQPFWWLCWSSLTSNVIYSSLETHAKLICFSRTQRLILSSKEHQAVVEIWPQIFSSDHTLQATCCQGLYHSLPWKKSQGLDQASCSLSVWLCQLSKEGISNTFIQMQDPEFCCGAN